MLTPNLRIQDITARTAGVNLRNTVKVLRAVVVILEQEGNQELSQRFREVLQQSSSNDGERYPLEARPGMMQIEACDTSYNKLVKRLGFKRLHELLDGSDLEYGEN